jgi:hypothetical protein
MLWWVYLHPINKQSSCHIQLLCLAKFYQNITDNNVIKTLIVDFDSRIQKKYSRKAVLQPYLFFKLNEALGLSGLDAPKYRH